MTNLHIALLGPFVLYEKGQPVDLTIAKLQALLAYLAIVGRPQLRDQLLALLWAESHPEAARKNLRNRLWQLRQLTSDDLVVATGDTLAIGVKVSNDVLPFMSTVERELQGTTTNPDVLLQAIEQWRGPLLDGLQVQEAPEFELWLTQQRETLGRLYQQAIERLVGLYVQEQHWNSVIPLTQRGIAHDPLYEIFYQHAMKAYAYQGLRGEALQQYERLAEQLKNELDISPLPETEALRRRIIEEFTTFTQVRDQPSGMVAPAATSLLRQRIATGVHNEATQSQYTQATTIDDGRIVGEQRSATTLQQPFIGRQAQLAQLTVAYEASQNSQCRVVLIRGELGLGKSTLWQQWVGQLSNNYHSKEEGEGKQGGKEPIVLRSRCLNTTQALPFEPMRRLLGTLRCREKWERIADELLPVWQAELLHLAPLLQTVAQPAPTDEIMALSSESAVAAAPTPQLAAARRSPTEEWGLVAEALTQFLRAFHGKPLILFLDDLHWVDRATAEWLLYLTDRMAHEPLLLVAACRPSEMAPHLSQVIAQWQRDGILERVDLPHFTESESSELLTALGSNTTAVHHLHTQSGGNPYYLTQLSDVAIDGMPATLVDLVGARLSYLDEAWQPVLQGAAILEPTIDLAMLQILTSHSEEEIVDAIDGLLAATILVEQGESYEFAHPLLATILREQLSSARRKLLHRRAAKALHERFEGQLNDVAGQLADHYGKAGEIKEAAHFATIAGEEALNVGAINEAVAFYRQAIVFESTATRLLGLGQALTFLPGQMEEARTTMQQALHIYEEASDIYGTVKAGLRLAASYLGTQEVSQVLYWARQVLPDLETIEDPLLHASAYYLMATATFRNGYGFYEAEEHYRQAMALVTTHNLDPEIALLSCFEWGNLCLQQGDHAEAINKFREAQVLAQRCQSILFHVLTLNNLAYAYLQNNEITVAESVINQATELATTYVLSSVQYYLLSTRGEIALALGSLGEAAEAFRAALELTQKFHNQTFEANLQAHLGRIALARGDVEQAHTLLLKAKTMIVEEVPYLQTQIDLWLANVAFAQQANATVTELLAAIQQRPAVKNYKELQRQTIELAQHLDGKSILQRNE